MPKKKRRKKIKKARRAARAKKRTKAKRPRKAKKARVKKSLRKKTKPRKMSKKKVKRFLAKMPVLIKPKPAAKKEKPEDSVHRTKIRVIGIGGGGGSIVSEIASRVKRASFVVANTDSRALNEARRGVSRFQFGKELTHSLGTGMNPELGEIAALQEKEKIKKLCQGQDFVIIIVCLGGGTGSGAASLFAKICKSLGIISYGIFTLPFKFEGEKKMEIAIEYLKKIKPNFNAVSIVPNERIFQLLDKSTPWQSALSAINRILAEGLEGLIEMIYEPGLINIDFADLKTILADRGKLAYLSSIEVQGGDRLEQAIKKMASNPLYPYTIKGARGILYNIVGEKELQLEEVSQLSKVISELVSKEAKIIFGVAQSPKYKDKIKITLLATGCSLNISSPQKPHPPATLPAESGMRAGKKAKARVLDPSGRTKARKITRRKKSSSVPLSAGALPLSAGLREDKEKTPPAKKLKNKTKKTETKPSPAGSGTSSSALWASADKPKGRKKTIASVSENASEKSNEKIRRTALQVKKDAEEQEKEIIEKENIWDAPAVLRKKKNA